jgi:hypothetical protein
VLDRIEKDISDLKKSNQDIREKIFNGISTDIPEIKKNIASMVRRLGKLEGQPDPNSNKRPAMPRILGSIGIAAGIGVGIALVALLMIVTGIVDLEDIGKMIGAILEKL